MAPVAPFCALGLSGALFAAWAPAVCAQHGVGLAARPTEHTACSLFGSASTQNITPGDGFSYSIQPGLQLQLPNPVAEVPEPSALMLAGLALLCTAMRRRRDA